MRKLILNEKCGFYSKFNYLRLYRISTNHLRLYRITTIRSGERNIQLFKAIQYNSININPSLFGIQGTSLCCRGIREQRKKNP